MNRIDTPRRRFIGIIASTSALALAPRAIRPAAASAPPASATWRGIALGADAQLRIHHPDPAWSQELIRRALIETRRLENIFSLYQRDSALARLNRDGHLENAPGDLLRLLQESQGYSLLTGGAFDPSVQALWILYTHAASTGAGLPDEGLLRQALQCVDHRAIQIQGRDVRLAVPGMALTLNGIAQGYITDRVTELLRDAGLEHALVNMGEIRGLNSVPGHRPWRVGLADDSDARKPLEVIEIRNRAVSTSAGRGTLLDAAGKITHIFDPHGGHATPRYRSVSVEAATATMADALSTAFSVMGEEDMRRVAAQTGSSVWILRKGSDRLDFIG
ncbi:FAD:protein FMN transferase [Alcaligenaceae bacterium]|nr:FAD:protein FMN transferase [Alcaligenaceae bacterium]